MKKYDVKDLKLSKLGKNRIEWANKTMPVLNLIKSDFQKRKPLKGVKVAACLHVTTETANLMITLKAGGAIPYLCASNPLSTQDDVAASLVKDYGISVFAIKGEDKKTYYSHIKSVLDAEPSITMDDGADLVSELHSNKKREKQISKILGGTEETTTGVIRLKSLASQNLLRYPIIAVNDALTKHMFDNRYGTGQSTLDGILRSTNTLLAGKKVVVIGYGWCGRGLAMRARGLGALVTVCEVDPLKALEATMDGFNVDSLNNAARTGDLFVTLTGDYHVIDKHHIEKMKDGAIICNSGHFNVEINIEAMEKIKKSKKEVRPFVEEYELKNNRKIYLLGEGRLINLAAAEGHPAEVMDMSFANQSLSCEYILKNYKKIGRQVIKVPDYLDEKVAKLKLKSKGIKIDTLTKEQKKYLASWEFGT